MTIAENLKKYIDMMQDDKNEKEKHKNNKGKMR